MRVLTRVPVCIAGIAFCMLGMVAAPLPLLFTGGGIYTGDHNRPRAESVLAMDGRIAFVGSAAEARRRAPPDVRVVELGERALFPGFVDSHAHPVGIGNRELSFNLEGTKSVTELQARLKQRAAETSGSDGWIVGRGWIESQWLPARFPSRQDLDAVVSDRPVYLTRADGHSAIVNTRALEVARIDRTTPNPTGGEIMRDERGEASGMLIDRAMELVRRLIPPSTPTETARALEVGAEREMRLGWTQVHVAGANPAELAAMRELVAGGKTRLRLYIAVSGPGAAAENLLEEGAVVSDHDGQLTVRTIKCFIDGALGSRGAALLEPYADAPDSRGLLMNEENVLLPLFTRALQSGIQVETHAIGDRGNRLVLDLYEKAFAAVPKSRRMVAEPRWRIEHAQNIDPADIPRFKRLGVIASMQPSHAISDLYFAPDRLGKTRLAAAYAWRSLIDSGAIIAGGSDAPVERGEPLIEFYAAVARRSLDGFANEDWHREQRVTRAEALKMFTLWPALASFEEHKRGSLEVGNVADFTVFSSDIMAIPEEEILRAKCVMTVIGGEVVWESRE